MTFVHVDFANGDTDYVAHLNTELSAIETDLDTLFDGYGALAGVTHLATAYLGIFGSTAGVLDDTGLIASIDGSSIDLTAGYAWLPVAGAVYRAASPTSVDLALAADGTYYVTIDSSGAAQYSAVGTDALYSVVKSGGTLGTLTRVANTLFSLLSPLDETHGGTGKTVYAVGDLLYADTTTSLARLADVATGSLLVSGGVGVAPAWSAAVTVGTSLTSPLLTATTSTTSPIVYGGSGVASTLKLRATSGAGAGSEYVSCEVGNNGATEIWRATPTGLGVGGSAPSYLLHARKDGNFATSVVSDNQGNSAGTAAELTARNAAGRNTTVGIFGASTSALGAITAGAGYLYCSSATGLVVMADHASAPLLFAAGGQTEQMRLSTSGQLGIGGSPSFPLHVTKAQNAGTTATVTNATAGTGAYAALSVASSAATGYLYSFSASYTTAGAYAADAVVLEAYNDASGGLNLVSSHASGAVRVYAGGSGSGNLAATFGTSGATLATSITSPILIGGTGVASTLSLRATSGVGGGSECISFQVGNNGATEVARLTPAGLLPQTTNTYDLGGSGSTWRYGYFGSNVGVGNFSTSHHLYLYGTSGTVRAKIENTSTTGYAEVQLAAVGATELLKVGVGGNASAATSYGDAAYIIADAGLSRGIMFASENTQRMQLVGGDLVLGNVDAQATARTATGLRGPNVSGGTNVAGTDFTTQVGLGTGTGTAGSFIWKAATQAASGSTAHTATTAATLNVTGLAVGTGAPSARLHVAGNLSASAWTTSGIGLRIDAATYTDTSSSGTVAACYVSRIAAPTLAASSSTTYTEASTLVLSAPAAGSNVTIGKAFCLHGVGHAIFDNELHINNGQSAANTTDTHPLIHGTSSGGGAYPYNQAGHLILQSRPSGANRDVICVTGTSQTVRHIVDGLGNVVIGALAAVSTSATDGFLYIPSCAGVPSGVPTSFTGKVALIYDSTNNRIYAYSGAWRQVAVA